MKYSQSFIKTKKETPRGANSINQALLERGSFIYQVGSGIFAYLPLGYKVYENICRIVREELGAIGCQEVSLPVLHPSELWKTSGRFEEIGDELLKVNTSREAEFVLAMTHEEVMTPMAKEKVSSFQDLPFTLNQISKKIRYEARPRGGMIRLRDFNMQDAYSFHANDEQLDKTFDDFIDAYKKIFERVGIKAIMVEADSGMMGGKDSREFMVITPVGEDRILLCDKCGKAFNAEVKPENNKCTCGNDLKEEKGIELAHIFKLRTKYSEKFGLNFTDEKGESKPVIMGCYGIGLDRLVGAVAETSNDEYGLIWPENIAPAKVYLIDLEGSKGEEIYNQLTDLGIDVIFDDREVSAGIKFSDADLLGIPYRVVISKKTIAEGKVELKKRGEKETILTDVDNILSDLRK
ncbi:TPA: proline--tRNA ligase [Candidatus Berkelbacteria bacterium]|uniref:Proline--tRNA ligase n=1 Tax=Berkelbacteria bacterium GW2011_GWE1_39_12 TaxID=1618337 RepID=A0A0G4B223_9BACT|nr:MAG: prolyl-tRNA synthetase, prolyl-tRNA synthetase [Berkelbacteria bacterium GW2011_GWE1_39_12]HBO60606.1 proline--tRNA ligase [Candidatus Berkelbacteria bacterium]